MKPSICLNMIVKNEAHCIASCLQSVKPFIDYYVISDTGSTDNTKNVIKQVLTDIPGEIKDHNWVDFSINRNLALADARNKSDYILFIDADDQLVYNSLDVFNNITSPAHQIVFHQNDLRYSRICLISNNIAAQYKGMVHEYLEIDNDILAPILKNTYINFGYNNQFYNKDKYIKYNLLLQQELKQDPNNKRAIFYLALSYRDLENIKFAAALFVKRAHMGGWRSEVYCSILETAKIFEKLYPENPQHIIKTYTQAYNCIPERAEALAYLATYCRKINRYDLAYYYASKGVKLQKPISDLFMEASCYDWIIKDELATAAFYLNKKDEFIKLSEELLQNKTLPIKEQNRIMMNLITIRS